MQFNSGFKGLMVKPYEIKNQYMVLASQQTEHKL